MDELKRRVITSTAMMVLLLSCLSFMPEAALAYGIDDMVGDKWRVGTFLFLVFGMILYAAFVVVYMRSAHGKLKKGEFIMLSTILGGVMLGFVVAFVQFVEGFLL